MLIFIFLVYLACVARQQILQILEIASKRNDLSSLIRNEHNLTKLKQINDEIQAKLNVLQPKQVEHEIKAEIGVEHQHMEVPAGRSEVEMARIRDLTRLDVHQVDEDRRAEDRLQVMEEAVEKVKQEQFRRGGVAGTVVVMGYFITHKLALA